jgi:hypothetical protein
MGCGSALEPAPRNRELSLKPGMFDALEQTALGNKVVFDNDIYSADCYPAFVVTGGGQTTEGPVIHGTISQWVHRAHAVDGRVFVQTCEMAAPFEATSAHINGYLSDTWFEMTVAKSDARLLTLRPLAINEWSRWADPVFCGRHVAVWSVTKTAEASGYVIDLFKPSANESAVIGAVEVTGGDMGWGLPAPVWADDCSAVTFKTGTGTTRVVRAPK